MPSTEQKKTGNESFRNTDPEAIFKERLSKLNKAQKKVVENTDGPLLVVAGPGSGKTEILSMRVAEILRKTHAMPSNILCLTFTDAAAQNMRERLSNLIGDRAYQVSIHTFHNFCVDIIRKHGEFFYHGATFTPLDPVTQIAILESIFTNLKHDNPLRSHHPEEGFVYIRPVLSAIAHTKKAGLRPEELHEILDENMESFNLVNELLIPVLDKKIGKDSIAEIKSALDVFTDKASKALKGVVADVEKVSESEKSDKKDKSDKKTARPKKKEGIVFHSLPEAIALSLAEAIHKAEAEEKNEPLSKWKTKWLTKDDVGNRIFKDQHNHTKMKSFADIYATYQAETFRRGYFDFDDMILDVISALIREPRLRYELQEQYQYLLVDEFQDTNNAQMRILSLLTSAKEHEGRPNIMVVGDDDQAIYKFQGAELSNILDFKHRFIDVDMVSMTENYRSTQDILNIAMKVIRKGEKRLENLIPDLSKQLVASADFYVSSGSDEHKKRNLGIEYRILETALHEYTFVADKIKDLIEAGAEPKEIAVIARKHEHLEGLVPYMKRRSVPIKYEREQSVFAEPHIREIIVIAKYISSAISALSHESARDDLLPQILSFAFWNIPRSEIWKISLAAKKENKTWLEVMSESENQTVSQIAEFLVELSVDAKSEPLPIMIDRIVGAHLALSSEDEKDDIYEADEDIDTQNKGAAGNAKSALKSGAKPPTKSLSKVDGKFISPFREFYFSRDRFSHARAEYLTFLSSLRVFINALRDFTGTSDVTEIGKSSYSSYTVLVIEDLVRFVDVYEKNNLKLNDRSPFVTARSAVELLSAHGSKGLEFKYVFILSCQDDVWASRGGGAKLSFPLNLPIEPAGDQEDDQLRLFYVAITRAREHLYLTSHEVRDNGKKASQLRFLIGSAEEYLPEDKVDVELHELLETSSVTFHTAPFLDTEEVLLKGILEDYKLSVTHLNNFLNIAKGGPALFFEQNLLRFPQSKTPSSSYGSAMHAVLECVLLEFKETGTIPQTDKINEIFEKMLRKQKLHPQDFSVYLDRGKSALEKFIGATKDSFNKTDIPEMDFGREMICIKEDSIVGKTEEAFITGKIDKISISEDGLICVHDYKTGKAFDSFEDPTASEALKVHLYKNQLLFYKLLISESAYAKQVLFAKSGVEVDCGVIDFVEPVGTSKKILSVKTELTRDEMLRIKKLAIAVYVRIKNLNFELPKEIKEKLDNGDYKNDIDGIIDFEEYLLSL